MRYAKTVVIMAVGIGLYYLLGRFAAIPGPVPGTFLTMQFAVLAVLAALSGSVTGGLTGFLGQLLLDLSAGGVLLSRVLPAGIYGILAGQLCGMLGIEKGELSVRDLLIFAGFQLAAHAAAGFLAAPCLDIFLYGKPPEEAFWHGLATGITHMVTTVLTGTVLCLVVATVRQGNPSEDFL